MSRNLRGEHGLCLPRWSLLTNLIEMGNRLKTTTSVVMTGEASHGVGGVSLRSIRAIFLER